MQNYTFSQSRLDSILGKLDPQKFAASIKEKAAKIEAKLKKKSLSILDKMQRQEEKIYSRMLKGKDSLIAKAKLQEIRSKYQSVSGNLNNVVNGKRITQYIPFLDSLQTSLKLFDENGLNDKMQEAIARTESLQQAFEKAAGIKNFIRERKQQLKEQLEKLGFVKQLKKINKQVYYYSQQLSEYKSMLNDPEKIQKKVLGLLSQTKFFREFMKRNSMLASLFPATATGSAGQNGQSGFAALQSRRQVTNFIQQTGFTGNNASGNPVQQSINNIQSQIAQIRSKLSQYGAGNSEDLEIPSFRPNNQKTKSFFKRLEFGTNIQSHKAGSFLPATTDFGMSVGYKLNDKSIIGIGTSYKMGWGRGWNNIRLSSEGIGIRSYIDWKIKNNWWLSGGYEQNYQSSFNSIYQLKDLPAWQQSGLLGISKTGILKTKFFKSTKLQLLWDFLSYRQKPRTQQLIFRIGYSFN